MNEFRVDDLAVITGPVEFDDGTVTPSLFPGEVVSVLHPIDSDGDYYVLGHESNNKHWISGESLSPLELVQIDLEAFDFGDEDRRDYSGIHDYVYTGDDE